MGKPNLKAGNAQGGNNGNGREQNGNASAAPGLSKNQAVAGEEMPSWLPRGLQDGLPEHLGGGLPPGWGGLVPGLLNTKSHADSECDHEDAADEVDEEDAIDESDHEHATDECDHEDASDGGALSTNLVLLEDGTLFDPVYYLESNPDVAAASVDPAAHYTQFGELEGRLPNDPLTETTVNDLGVVELEDGTLFDEAFYLEQNPDVAAAGISPLTHYLEYGTNEGRSPSSIDAPVEGTESSETLSGDVSDNLIAGGGGDDIIDGQAGMDLINGGAGNDVLTGGDGRDVFVIDINGDADTILDFSNIDDVVFIDTKSGITDFESLIAASTMNEDGDVMIEIGDASLLLVGVSVDDLGAGSFGYF